MRFEAKRCLDKSGKELILRNAELSDAADLIRYLKATTAETPFLIREPEEITLTEEQERKFIQSKIEDERELMLQKKCGIFAMPKRKRKEWHKSRGRKRDVENQTYI